MRVQDLASVVGDDEKAVRTSNVSVGTVKKSIAATASRWFLRNVSHRFTASASLGARRIHRATLLSEISKPVNARRSPDYRHRPAGEQPCEPALPGANCRARHEQTDRGRALSCRRVSVLMLRLKKLRRECDP